MPKQQQQQQTQNPSKGTKTPAQRAAAKRRRMVKKMNKRAMLNSGTTFQSVTTLPPSMPGVNPGIDNALRVASRKLNIKTLSRDGIEFLKCAFAPVDFAVTNVRGVPDNFESMSLVKRHRYVSPFTGHTGLDKYILLLPIPGVAYGFIDKVAGNPIVSNDVIDLVGYADTPAIFGNVSGAEAGDKVNNFRFISNHIELVNTTNQMSWSGSIQTMKAKIQVALRPSSTAANQLTVSGIASLNNFGQTQQYSAPFANGVYAAAYNSSNDFPFTPIYENVNLLPQTIVVRTDYGQLNSIVGNIPIPGFDNSFETVVIKISGLTSNVSALLKTWACVEYQVVAGSLLYEYQNLSPCDPIALQVYKEVIKQLPTAVGTADNPDFWERVLKIIKQVSGVGMMLPGPYGAMSTGVNTIASAMESLLI